jgi:hypothetical protein
MTDEERMALDRLHLELQERLAEAAGAVVYGTMNHYAAERIHRFERKRDDLAAQSDALAKVLNSLFKREQPFTVTVNGHTYEVLAATHDEASKKAEDLHAEQVRLYAKEGA